MGDVDSAIEPYRRILKALGERLSLNKIKILEYIADLEGGEFTIVDIAKKLDIKRGSLYPLCRHLFDLGFLRVKEIPSLPDGFYEWNTLRRSRYKRRIEFPRRITYVVDLCGVMKTVEDNIVELCEIRELIWGLKKEERK